MKALVVLALLFILPTALADRDPCEDYCRGGLFYTGTLNADTQLCEYRQTTCEHGCSSDGQSCAPSQSTIPSIVIPATSGGSTSPVTESKPAERGAPVPAKPRTSTAPDMTLFRPKATRGVIPPKKPFVPRDAARTLKPGACFTDADCAKDTTLSKCEGAWQCLQLATKGAGKCVPVQGMTVVCEELSGFPCDKSVCDPATGECEFVPDFTKKTPEGKPCLCYQDKDCAAFEDGNLCNGKLYCDKMGGACKVNPSTEVTCSKSSDTACMNNLCNPKTGKCSQASVNEGKSCDGGHPCIDAACVKGACTGKWNYDKQVKGKKCQCKNQGDCAKYEDGDVCNGTLYCDLAATECKLNPATTISCPSVDDTTCGKNTCNPKTGKCGMLAINEGLPCFSSLCYDGACAKGKCATFLNKKCECVQDADCAKYQKDKCSGGYYCDKSKGKCVFNPVTVVTCPTVDDTACLKNTCEPATGKCTMAPALDGAPCDLGHACIDAACSKGVCMGEWNYNKQVKDKKCQCKNNADCAKYEDGDLCNGTLFCNKATTECQLNPSTKIACKTVDDTACGKNTCDPKTGKCGMKPAPEGTLCDLGHACIDAACSKGVCAGSWNFAKIANGKKCQCKDNKDCAKYEDGIACNGTLYCDKAATTCKINPKTVTC